MAINATLTVSSASDTAVCVRCTRKGTLASAILQLAAFTGLLFASLKLVWRGSYGFSALLLSSAVFWASIYLSQVCDGAGKRVGASVPPRATDRGPYRLAPTSAPPCEARRWARQL